MTRPPLAVVAGTGFYDLEALADPVEQTLDTAWGQARVVRGTWHGLPVAFLTRHGAGHSVPPHRVGYRANIRALADLGCRDVLAVNVTGSIDEALSPGDLVCVDDFLDLTRQRPLTFFDGSGPEGVVHTDVSDPYDPALRAEILAAAAAAGHPMVDGGVYACFEGPRFETAAEIRLARLAGGTVAGMTGVPEVTLAREAGLRYAAVSLVVNPATGVGDTPITMADIEEVLARSRAAVLEVLGTLVRTRAADDEAGDVTAPDHAAPAEEALP
ncbi:S-methyl-5'-thioinosine phosphorylase [Phycicoccus flavus]|uniref:S-methyl-5'-thioinosine phosphorylase n=1 Tax=Phycicoccus flavus TaxID=2502783 RepID=UPI000FEBB9FA|nr:S-methyl-5'-thioinosine phosphorylase [Phycicoccus flavus]NHA69271.1 S-methyl-5'-thioinosine phosphorylase [Phycicoccus flavus]